MITHASSAFPVKNKERVNNTKTHTKKATSLSMIEYWIYSDTVAVEQVIEIFLYVEVSEEVNYYYEYRSSWFLWSITFCHFLFKK